MARSPVIPGLLPQRKNEVWQGGWFQSPFWVTTPDGRPSKGWLGLWTSPSERFLTATNLFPERGPDESVLDLLNEMFEDTGRRPGRVEVSEAGLHRLLSKQLESSEIEVALRARLKGIDEALDSMASRFGVPDYQGALEVPGITVESMRRFARAARAFYESAPWRHLSDRDLFEIRGGAPPGFPYAVVLGMGRETYGLGFFEDVNAFWSVASGNALAKTRASSQWLLSYGTIADLPPADAQLWVDHELEIACPHAYPLARLFQSASRVKRPSPKVLDYLTGLLEALSSSGPEDFDRGRWERTVASSAGSRSYQFLLPYLLEPPSREELARREILPDLRAFERFQFLLHKKMADLQPDSLDAMNALFAREFQGKPIDEIPYQPLDDRERAQEICFEAFDAWGRRQLQLVDQALALDSECVDALVLKGERTADAGEALGLFERAVAAGEKVLKTRDAREGIGELWSYYPARPYLRALHSLAHALEDAGEVDKSFTHYRRVLALDKDDHQGVRHCLLSGLLVFGHYREAEAHIKANRARGECLWDYAHALAAFGRYGDGKKATQALARALEHNPVAAIRLLDLDVPEIESTEAEDDAEQCVHELAHAWAHTRGADRWLARELEAHASE